MPINKSRRRKKKNHSSEILIKIFSVKEKLPPKNSKTQILVWEEEWEYDVRPACIVYDHILNDYQFFKNTRVKYWGFIND